MLLIAIVALSASPGAAGSSAPRDDARTERTGRSIVASALAAQGGEERLRAVRSVQWSADGYRNMLEQSERPEGPYFTEFQSVSETDDIEHDRMRSTVSATVQPFGTTTSTTILAGGIIMRVSGDAKAPGTFAQVQVARERQRLSPERLLLTAATAQDLRRLADVSLQSIRQEVVTFTLDGAPVTIYFNSATHLPTAMDYSGPLARSGYWSFLGDVTRRTLYGFWSVDPSGIRYPMQLNFESNGLPDSMLAIHDLRINGKLDESGLTIPEPVRSSFLAAKSKPAPALAAEQVIAPGIVFVPGSWNTTIVRQDDGIVIIEAPISTAYSQLVIAAARRLFPGVPIKALVTTSDSWPHFAGIREYVASGVPVYALDLNIPILSRNAAAPYSSKPDLQERLRHRPLFRPVSHALTIGTGVNRLELIPIRGETTERQMIVYFPGHRLLYGSDAFQRDGSGTFTFQQAVDEVVAAAARERLGVDRFYMMHISPTGWTSLPKAAAAVGNSQ